IIFDLKESGRYPVLVWADQECLADGDLEWIEQCVAHGQGLVATGLTSLYTPQRKIRRDFGLANLFNVHAQQLHAGEPITEILHPGPPIRNETGKGRVVYIPEVKPSIPRPPVEPMTSK